MPVNKIDSNMLNIPPPWMGRVIATTGYIGDPTEIKQKIRKILGEPPPEVVDLDSISPEIAAMFAATGTLGRIRRKLESLSKRRGKAILPAKGTIASVDENDIVYVGVDFLEEFGDQEALLAGILAHEWGHIASEPPTDIDWEKVTLEDLLALRRDEEAGADAFAGKALYLMGYSVDDMIKFLSEMEVIEEKLHSPKYHSTEIRIEILKEAFATQRRHEDTIKKMFVSDSLGFRPTITSKLIAEG